MLIIIVIVVVVGSFCRVHGRDQRTHKQSDIIRTSAAIRRICAMHAIWPKKRDRRGHVVPVKCIDSFARANLGTQLLAS